MQTHIKVLSDNATTVCVINNMGSCKSLLCDQEVRKIWSWAIERDIFTTAAHVPSILNLEADQESRKLEQNGGYMNLSLAIFRNI